MAITIEQRPSTPNYSRNPLVYVLSSDNINEVEFTYVVEIVVGTRTFTYEKQSNPSSRGIIDISSIANDNLEWEIAALGATSEANTVSQRKTFGIRFGELFQVNGLIPDTPMNFTSTENVVIIKGASDNDTFDLTDTITIPTILSNQQSTSITIHRDDKMTVTRFDSTNNVILHDPLIIPTTDTTFTQDIGGTTFDVTVYDERSLLDEVRFAWFNKIGGIEYHTATQEGTRQNAVDKLSSPTSPYTHGFTTSSKLDPMNTNVWKTTSNNYRTDFVTTFTKRTEWLDQSESEQVSGLFESPAVYIQVGTRFRPVEIMNSSYNSMTQAIGTPNFNFEIMYRFINDKQTI